MYSRSWAVAALFSGAALCAVAVADENFGATKTRQLEQAGAVRTKLLDAIGDADTRPPPEKDAFSSVIVEVDVHIVEATWVGSNLHVKLYLRERWQDSRLVYADADGLFPDGILLDGGAIWSPNTYFAYGHEKARRSDRVLVRVDYTGHVLRSEMLEVEVPCDASDAYPLLNKHSCTLQIGSYKYDTNDVVYAWRGFEPVSVNHALEEYFGSKTADDCTTSFDKIGKYSCLSMTVEATHKTLGTVLQFYLSTVVLLIISWLHVWLRTSWIVARPLSAYMPVMLLAVVILCGVYPMDVCAVRSWLTVCLLLALVSAIEFTLVALCHGAQPSGGHVLLSQEPAGAGASGSHEQRPLTSTSVRSSGGTVERRSKVDLLCRAALPIALCVWIVIYLLFYLVIA